VVIRSPSRIRSNPSHLGTCQSTPPVWPDHLLAYILSRIPQGAINAAESALSGMKYVGPQAIQAAQRAIDGFKNANEAALKAAQKAINDLATSAAYLAFRAAESALSAAQSASATLDAAKATLEATKKAAGGILWLAGWIATHAVTLVNVREVNLSGQISHAARGDAMGAAVKGTIAGKDFSLNEMFDPRHVEDFINSIFQT
jgi:multidrug efflux pump subunit AcrA (membrane-fusion protein)